MKALHGGPFGAGRYALASVHDVESGFDRVRFAVVEPRAGLVLSVASAKVDALAMARRLLAATAALGFGAAANDSCTARQAELFPDDPIELNQAAKIAKQVPRRRREVFERSGGRCCYCDTPLTLDGRWHVEHQLPRALGGGDELGNLVAACVECNLEKGDRTAVEFVAQKVAYGQR